MRVIGLDIGGANLKASDGESLSLLQPFALWNAPERLSQALGGLLSSFGQYDALAVTMTGELADCFSTKSEGVNHILDAVERVSNGRPVHVWQTGGEFVTPAEARELVPLVAAANWHALATWAGRVVPHGAALLIDCGSTTTDIIPLQDGAAVPEGRTDIERLLSGELVYAGVRRTPLCAVASAVPFRGSECALAAELFATTLDVYLLLGAVPESPGDRNTADGRPATRAAARARFARMLCCDSQDVSDDDVFRATRFLAQALLNRLGSAVRRVLDRMDRPCGTVLTCGEGSFVLAEVVASIPRLTQAQVLPLDGALGPQHSRAACGFALARLLSEWLSRAPAADLLN